MARPAPKAPHPCHAREQTPSARARGICPSDPRAIRAPDAAALPPFALYWRRKKGGAEFSCGGASLVSARHVGTSKIQGCQTTPSSSLVVRQPPGLNLRHVA